MTSDYPETTNFGLTRVGEGESLQKNNFGATDGNFVSLDRIMKVLADHDHTGGTRLADPTAAPELVASTSGGFLPAGQTYYYQYSYVDIFGLETAASPEVSVTTPPPLGVPTAPALSVEATGGTLGAGIYRYVLASRTPGGGVTTTSTPAEITVDAGTTNRILINLPDLPAGAEALLIYRARPGQTQYFYWKESTTAADLYDDGSIVEDQTVLAPAYNTSSGTNSVTVTLPGGVVPAGVKMWRLYRTSSPGIYNGLNLVHLVSEGVTESSTDPRPDWIDDGSPLFRGQPRRSSATIAPPPAVSGAAGIPAGGTAGQVLAKVDAADYNTEWVDGGAGASGGLVPHVLLPRGLQSWSVFAPGTIEVGRVYAEIDNIQSMKVVTMSAYFQDAPTTDPTGAQIGFEIVAADDDNPDYFTDLPSYYSYYRRAGVGTDGTGQSATRLFGDLLQSSTAGWVQYGSKYIEAENGTLHGSPSLVSDSDNYSPWELGGKAVALATVGQWVDVDLADNLGPGMTLHRQGDYVATAVVYVPDATEADGIRVTLYKYPEPINSGAGGYIIAQQTFTADVAPATGTPNEFAIPFKVDHDLTYSNNHVFMRVEKVGSDSAAVYHVDTVTLESTPAHIGSGQVKLRATLVDRPDASVPPPWSTGPGKQIEVGWSVGKTAMRLYAREGITTTIPIPISSSDSSPMSWTATSNQAWCTLDVGSGSGASATVTASINYASLAAGARAMTTVTFAATGYRSLVVQIVALRTPAALGGNANVHVQFNSTF